MSSWFDHQTFLIEMRVSIYEYKVKSWILGFNSFQTVDRPETLGGGGGREVPRQADLRGENIVTTITVDVFQ